MTRDYIEDLERKFSLFKVLSGLLGVIYGEEFACGLLNGNIWKKEGAAGSSEELPSEQGVILNLISAAEIHRTAGRYESLKKTCHVILSVMRESFPRDLEQKRRDIFLGKLSSLLFGGLGDYLTAKGIPGEALKFYQDLLLLAPADADTTKKLARIFYTMGPRYLSEAERLYRDALTCDPSDLEAVENLGRVLTVSKNGMDEARLIFLDALQYCCTDMERMRFYERLLELMPEDRDILVRMGKLYQRHGMFIEARRCLEKLDNLQGELWEILDLAYLYYLLHDLNKAETLLTGFQSNEGESYFFSCYLWGLLKKEDEDWGQAQAYFQEVTPGSPSYWKAQTGLAQVYLAQDDYQEAATLARAIPPKEWDRLGNDFLLLCEALENVLQHKSPSLGQQWREHVNAHLPSFYLQKDVQKRSMGSNFWRKYEAVDVIGRGPVGQVLQGRERQRGAPVAIKYLPGEFLSDPLAVRRIQGMTKLWRSMGENNPQVVRAFEDCYFEGSFFYAMEYLERDLHSVIKSWAPAAAGVVASIGVKICDALSSYYRYNMDRPHGDLKPENILIAENFEIRISDFDLLWALEGKKIFSARELRQHASFLRTFYYFAPERITDNNLFSKITGSRPKTEQNLETVLEGIDQRSDLYSLGVILFELATGFLPFETNIKSLLAFHKAKTPPSPRFYNPSIHPELEKIITCLMSREPSWRFKDPGEVKRVLQMLL